MGWRKSWIRRGGYRGDVGAPVGRRGKQSTKNERHTRGTNKQERPDTEHTRARPNKGDPPSTERESETSLGARARERAPTESSTESSTGERALTESREASAERTWSSGGRSSHEFTLESGIAELEHDVVRLDWAERDAYGRLLAAIQEHDSTREAYARWQSVRERRLVAEARLDVLQAARRASRRQGR